MIDELHEVLDKLRAADPCELSDPDSIVELHRCLARLDAVVTRATAAFDADSSWQGDGARTTAAWLAARCRIPQRSAQRRVALARALRHLPAAAEAWLAGDIADAHVDLLARARNEASAEALERDEQMLVAEARRHRFGWFARIVAYWRHSADADGIEDEAAAQHQRRRLHHSQSIEGMWFGDYVLDPISGTVVGSALARIEHELFHADWAEAKAALGRDPQVAELARTPAQRRADALVEMARRAGAVGPGARLAEPLFTVLVGYEAFSGRMCQLADNTVVSPGSLVRWMGEAWVERVVFGPGSRVIDVGVRRRLFAGATRRAVEVRDLECFHPTCEVPAENCEIDHVAPWAAGGLTTTANGRAACAFHNRARHRRRAPPLIE